MTPARCVPRAGVMVVFSLHRNMGAQCPIRLAMVDATHVNLPCRRTRKRSANRLRAVSAPLTRSISAPGYKASTAASNELINMALPSRWLGRHTRARWTPRAARVRSSHKLATTARNRRAKRESTTWWCSESRHLTPDRPAREGGASGDLLHGFDRFPHRNALNRAWQAAQHGWSVLDEAKALHQRFFTKWQHPSRSCGQSMRDLLRQPVGA